MLQLLCFKLQIELSRCQSYYLSVIFFFPFLFSLNRAAAEINLKERPSNKLKEAQCFFTTNLRKLHVMGMNSNFKVGMKTEAKKETKTTLRY